MEFATREIHGGQEPDSSHGAVTVPIYSTSTYNTSFTRIIDLDRE
jgi:O-acetylhomoserine/O-acetylserine sulfhydrylase-like pyridoxal-dependent enzyme